MKKTLKIFVYAIAATVVVLGGVSAWVSAKVVPGLPREALSQYAYETLTLKGSMQVNYRTLGNPDGPELLFIHSAGGSVDDWNPWLLDLQDDYRINLVDLPGHGLTDPLVGEYYSPTRFATFIGDIVEELDLKNYTLIGHGIGGDSAVRYALAYPNGPVALVLIASGGYRQPNHLIPQGEKELAWWAELGFAQAILPLMQSRAAVQDGLDHYFYDKSAMSEALIDRVYNLLRYEKNRGAMTQLRTHSMHAYVNVSGLEKLKLPALILWGEEDPVALVEFAYRFEKELPSATLKVYPDVGHMVHMENTEQSVSDVKDFLESVYVKK